MVMQLSIANNVKVYDITSAAKSALPDWIAKTNKKSLQKDIEYRNRLELIQDFEFPEASIKLKQTRDGQHIMATGVYKPHMRVFELRDLALKFERHTDAENVNFEILSDDWTKSVHLQNDRSVEFHTQSGMHFRTRVPRFGRDLAYSYPTCDLIIVGASDEAWRIHLEKGRFMTPLVTDLKSINSVTINPANQLWALGGEEGTVEFWHPTQKRRLATLDVASVLRQKPDWVDQYMSNSDSLYGATTNKCEITCLEFGDDGLSFAVGVSTGQVLTYDLRRPTPLLVKDHQYGFPIKSIHYHNSGNILSADTKIVKIWDKNNGNMFTSVEPPNDINDTLIDKDSGLLMIANEGVRIQSYYIPQLGPAPAWCPFLENMTEELEENPSGTQYDDYKFVTRKELNTLGLDHLIGTHLLRAYMHGFFVDLRLYEKARSILNPFDYEKYKEAQIQAKIQKERESRIRSVKKNMPQVNRAIATKLLSDEQDGKKKKVLPDAAENASVSNPLGDDRFAAMFKDDDYEVDFTSHEYKLHHPSEAKKPALLDRFELLDDEGESQKDSMKGSDSEDLSDQESTNKTRQPSFYAIKAGVNPNNLNSKHPIQDISKTSFEERVKVHRDDVINRKTSGNMSVTFKVRGRGVDMEKEEEREFKGQKNVDDHKRNKGFRRGVASLRLKRHGAHRKKK